MYTIMNIYNVNYYKRKILYDYMFLSILQYMVNGSVVNPTGNISNWTVCLLGT